MAKNYSIVPSNEELDRCQRDLSFHPVANAHPQILSAADLKQFNATGYLTGLQAYGDQEILEVRNYFDALLQDALERGADSYSISSAHLKHGRVYDMMTRPTIVNPVADLLGENVIGWGAHFFCKMPGDGKAVAWHQDSSYWPLSPSKTVTVWLAIDDADTDNACMRFISGSHTQGHLTYRPSSPEEHNVLNQTVDDAESFGSVVNNELRAGQFSIHSDLLLHGSQKNTSKRRRCALTLRYCTPDVRAGSEWNEKGVWVKGTDSSGHWTNNSRPVHD